MKKMTVICSICFDNLFHDVETESVSATVCGHVFHFQCLVQWLNSSTTCPDCRSYISINNLLKLNLHFESEASKSPALEQRRVTRSSVKHRQQRTVSQSELAWTQSELKIKTAELALQDMKLQQLERKCRSADQENERLRFENKTLTSENSSLKTELQTEREKNVIFRSDLRIMDIIDLDPSDDSPSRVLNSENGLIDLTS